MDGTVFRIKPIKTGYKERHKAMPQFASITFPNSIKEDSRSKESNYCCPAEA